MDYENKRVVDLKAFTKGSGLKGCSRLKKAELIAPRPPPPPKPIPAPRPPPALCTRPPRPTRPLPPPPVRPRQPELRPYQLKTKRGKEPFIEPPMEQK